MHNKLLYLNEKFVGCVNVFLGVRSCCVICNCVQMIEGDHDQVTRILTQQDLVFDCHDHQIVQLEWHVQELFTSQGIQEPTEVDGINSYNFGISQIFKVQYINLR